MDAVVRLRAISRWLQYLRFPDSGYDSLCAHMVTVLMSYDLLALCQCEEADERTLGTCSSIVDNLYRIWAWSKP